MRSEFVVQLIEAYSSSDAEKFKDTVMALSEEERKKGNNQLSTKILSSFKDPSYPLHPVQKTQKDNRSFSPSSGLTMFEPSNNHIPRDKASNSSLIDWHYPEDISDETLILSPQISEQIQHINSEFQHRNKLLDLGLGFENRILLCGPPGCGKTSSAFTLAKSLGIPLAYVRLDSLISSLLGQTGTNIRKIFDSVDRKNVILFLDEFDAIAKKRDDTHELGELKRVVNTLLQNIDGLSSDVLLIAATNHHNLLDSAVWRRFNTVLYLELPEYEMRIRYLDVHISKYPVKSEVDVSKIANITKGFNFSQLRDVIIKTIKNALFHEEKKVVTTADFLTTVTNSLMLFNESSVDTAFLQSLKNNGLTLREITEITGIPKSTVSDRIKEMN